MITVRRYCDNDKDSWNEFNKNSKNSLFMFDRNYMDYHRDRFVDHSLIFECDNEIVAILPISQHDDVFISHGGLTYGGFITNAKMKQHLMNECFAVLLQYAKNAGISKIRYKTIPHIYHNQPAEEDRFALFACNAKVATIDASTYVNLENPLKMPKGRKAQISRARRENVEVVILDDFESYARFIDLENAVLVEKHNTHAAHTGSELKMLHDAFPENIRLYAAKKEGRLIAGTVIYIYENVVHTQYMAADEEARRIGALDLAISTIIDKYMTNKKWLDFGISTEHDRIFLNEGLISQKESFGGRTGVYEIWDIAIS